MSLNDLEKIPNNLALETHNFDKKIVEKFIKKVMSSSDPETEELLSKKRAVILEAINAENLDGLDELSKLISSHVGYHLEKSHDPGDEDKLVYLEMLQSENSKICKLIASKQAARELQEKEKDPEYYQDLRSEDVTELKRYLMGLINEKFSGEKQIQVMRRKMMMDSLNRDDPNKLFNLPERIESEQMKKYFNRWLRMSTNI